MRCMRVIPLILLLAASGAAADAEIYRCPLDDGTFAFQQMPCPEPAEASDEPEPGPETEPLPHPLPEPLPQPLPESSPSPSPEEPRPAEPPLPARLSNDRAACEKETRDAIDAIDLEMRQTSYSQEQGEQYLADLLALTRQLRACKQL